MSWSKDGNKWAIWIAAAIAMIQMAMAENPQQSMRQLARHYCMDLRTRRNLVKEELGMKNVWSSSSHFWPQMLKKWGRRSATNFSTSWRSASLIKSGFFLMKKSSPGMWPLSVANMNPSIYISPLSKALLKKMVLGVVGSDRQKCPVVFVWVRNESMLTFIMTFCSSMWSPRSSGCI